ncbi:MAG: amidohydrolase family protein [Bacilli bacterium]|nr:amidohydrolase family protein [Bacilli bacterium]
MKAIINVRIYDYKNYIENGFVIFDEKIRKVGKMSDFKNDGYEVIDGNGQLLLPNFVCNHAHIYSIFARGLALPFNPHNFVEILEQMWWKMDAKIDNKTTYYSGVCAGKEFIENGVTTIIDHHASGTDIIKSLTMLKKSLVDDLGLRALLCFETSDRYPVDKCIKENISFMDKFKSDHVRGLFGMHASMTLSDKTLKAVARKLGDNPIHIHVAESEMDENDSFVKYHMSIMERLDKFGLVNPNSLIVHGVSISDKELDIVHKNAAYMVVNTTSNMNNAVGIPNVKNYLEHNIKVLVGNDGLSSNMATEYLNVLYTTHLYNKTPLGLGLGEVLEMINNSYDYVSKMLGIKLGKIEKDYESDFLLVPYKPFTEMNSDNAFGHVFYGLYPSFRPNDVYASGKLLLKNRKIVSRKVNRLFDEANEVSKDLWRRIKED